MKLLVTTDFSNDSKSAIRFALSLAKHSKNIDVVFYHSVHFLKPTKWHDNFYHAFVKEETTRLTLDLEKFVFRILKQTKDQFLSIKFIIEDSMSTDKGIVSFAEKNKIDFICIATKGAGILRKILGTHTSYLVNNSTIPVIVIPSHYKVKALKKATYLSDSENLKKELNHVNELSQKLLITFEILHFQTNFTDLTHFDTVLKNSNNSDFSNIKLNIMPDSQSLSLVEQINKYVDRVKPDLLVMFTNRSKGFFESMFVPSNSEQLTYTTKVPILVIPK